MDDSYLVSTVETLTAELLTDKDLEVQAANNTKVDFHNSPTLRAKTEDAMWRQDLSMDLVFKRMRELPWGALSELLFAADLYEQIRDHAS